MSDPTSALQSLLAPRETDGGPGLRRRNLRDEIRDVVIERILDGRLPCGQRINETHLAHDLGVSQTPVREALSSLANQSFLRFRRGRGFEVAPLDRGEARNLYDTLALLEVGALRAAGLPDEATVQRLRDLNREFRRASRHAEDRIVRDLRWHALLLEHCPNEHLLDLVRQTRSAIYRYEHAYMRDESAPQQSGTQHEAILDALAAGDLEAAVRRLHDNLLVGVEDLLHWIDAAESHETK